MSEIPKACKLADIQKKVTNAPNLAILKGYVLGWFEQCPEKLYSNDTMQKISRKKKYRKDSDEPKKPKKKRAPSAYNLYMKECIPMMKAQNPNTQHTDVFTMCAAEYKK